MLRRLLAVAAVVLAVACASTAALAGPPDDARAAADRFLAALAASDATTACNLLSARALAIVGGPQKCLQDFVSVGDDTPSSPPDSPISTERLDDGLALDVLYGVYFDARALALARGGYVTRQVRLTRLVNELRTLNPRLRFSIGTGPSAARAKDGKHVVVDRRTSGRNLLLYAESDSGSIWRLSAHGITTVKAEKAGEGVPANPSAQPTPPPAKPAPAQPEQPPTLTVTGVALFSDTSAHVSVVAAYEGKTYPLALSLQLENGAWKVDDILVGLLALLEGLQTDT
jgi:hypothetical protein